MNVELVAGGDTALLPDGHAADGTGGAAMSEPRPVQERRVGARLPRSSRSGRW